MVVRWGGHGPDQTGNGDGLIVSIEMKFNNLRKNTVCVRKPRG